MTGPDGAPLLERLTALRQHERAGVRSPHKPLLVLLALGRLLETGSSAMPWSWAEQRLAGLIADFGPSTRTAPAQSAAYPFTHLRSDLVWVLDRDVPMDRVTPLREHDVVGRLAPQLEDQLLADRVTLNRIAGQLAEAEFPPSLLVDVLVAAGLEPEQVLGSSSADVGARRRSAQWPKLILEAWDRQCAFCGYDGQLAGAPVGLEAAHVRWFNFDGPDDLDNGLALCSLHHKLFDRGVLGVRADHTVKVSRHFSARSAASRQVYELHGRSLAVRPGADLPALEHLEWHSRQVFKGEPLSA